MNNFDFKVFEATISHDKITEICEEINKNPKYQISEEAITELVDCKFILDILKEHKIEYKIATDNRLFQDKGVHSIISSYYCPVVCIFISQRDYVSIKHLLEPSNNEKSNEYDDDDYYDGTIKNIYTVTNIFFYLFLVALAIIFIAIGIKFYSEDKGFIVFSILGIGLVIYLIFIIKKRTNTGHKSNLKC